MFAFALTHPPTPLIRTEMYRISSVPVHKRDVYIYPLFIQRPFEISTGQFLGAGGALWPRLGPIYTETFWTV